MPRIAGSEASSSSKVKFLGSSCLSARPLVGRMYKNVLIQKCFKSQEVNPSQMAGRILALLYRVYFP